METVDSLLNIGSIIYKLLPPFLGIIIIGGFFYAVFRLLRFTNRTIHSVNNALNVAKDTAEIINTMKSQQQEYEQKPRSVSSMTNIYLPQITRDFPEFNLFEFKTKAENTLLSIFGVINACDISVPVDMASDDLKKKVQHIIDTANQSGEFPHYKNIKVHKTEISKYIKQSGTCRIVFETSLEYIYYTESRGTVKSGSMAQVKQTKYTTELVYVQDASKTENASNGGVGVTCPNCGAPITALGQKRCEYCLSAVTEINIHTWRFNNFEEVKY